MNIGGVSIILALGIANFLLLIFQLLSGFHKIKVPMGVHKKTGVALFIIVLIHGVLAILANA
ncbi:MAG: hypothetical protein A2176_03695 [Spirochaetes bacterium RBG_13_51_14]|nr:MAG: hypothetical protein A2176_03695 [Spirochaetes bacterium RBG_13_51_14]